MHDKRLCFTIRGARGYQEHTHTVHTNRHMYIGLNWARGGADARWLICYDVMMKLEEDVQQR